MVWVCQQKSAFLSKKLPAVPLVQPATSCHDETMSLFQNLIFQRDTKRVTNSSLAHHDKALPHMDVLTSQIVPALQIVHAHVELAGNLPEVVLRLDLIGVHTTPGSSCLGHGCCPAGYGKGLACVNGVGVAQIVGCKDSLH